MASDHSHSTKESANGASRYDALLRFNRSPAIIVETASGKIVGANESAQKTLGAQVGDSCIACLRDLVAESAREELESFVALTPQLANGKLSVPINLAEENGPALPANLHLSIDDSHEPSHIVGTLEKYADTEMRAPSLPGRRDQDHLLRLALEATADGLLVVEANGKVAFTNARFAEMWRIPADILESRDDNRALKFIIDQLEEPDLFAENVHELFHSRKHTLDTLYFKDGRVFERYSRPLIKDDEIAGRVWSFRDISVRKRTEDALRENEERYRRIYESIQDVYYETDLEGTILELSPSIQIHTDYTREQVLGRNMLEFYSDPKQREKFLEQLTESGRVNDYEITLRDQSGSHVAYSISSRLVRDENDVPLKIVGSMRNITDRKLAEDELRNSQQRLAILVEQSPLAVIVWNTEFVVVDWNPAAEKIFGFSASEAIGSNGAELVVPQDLREHIDEIVEELLSATGGYRSTNENVTKDGRRILCEWYNTPLIDENGSVIGISSFAQDVTEAVRAEDALRESEEKYRTILDSIDESYYETDAAGNLTFFNNSGCDLLGYSTQELKGLNNRDYMSEEDAKRVFEAFTHVHETGKPVPLLEYEIIRKDGEKRALETSVSLGHDRATNRAYFRGIARDVTDRKQAESALRESEEKYRTLVENINDVIFTVNKEGRFTYVSPAVERLTQFDTQEIVGKSFHDFIHPDDLDLLTTNFAQTLQGSMEPAEFRVFAKDGSIRHVRTSSRPITENGELVGLTGVMLDISERRKSEDAYRASQQMLRLVLDTVPLRIFWKDKDLNYLGCNARFAKDAGLSSPDEIVGKSDFELVWKDQAELYREDDRSVIESGVPKINFEEPGTARDGSDAWLMTSKVPLKDGDGNTVGVLAAYQDITEQKRTENERRALEVQVQQAQKLESLGVLAGGIAHDFNNLLTGMLGYTGLVRLSIDKNSAIEKHITQIEKVANRAADLTQQMLAYSGKGKFVVRPLDLSHTIEELTHLLAVSISKKAALHYEFDEALPAVLADGTQIQQIAMNLITNASDALGDEGGTITVRTGTIYADAQYLSDAYLDTDLPEGTYAFMEVSDTGSGMDPETMSKIFDPFFTTKFTGRGLGLAAVLGIVRGHDGTLKISSQPEEGTTIRILLPTLNEEVRSPAPASPDEDEGPERFEGQGTVLIVDDEEVVRDLASAVLTAAGFKVLTAFDGRDGVNVFKERAAEIVAVLLDLTMPNLDGEETFREMRAIRADIPVVLSSGYNEQEVVSRFDGQGLAGFIQKPYQMENLIAKMRDILQN